MYNKTTGPQFFKYGEIVDLQDYQHNKNYEVADIIFDSKSFHDLFCYESEVLITCLEGIAMLYVCENTNHPLSEFVIHSCVKLKPNIYFNIITMSARAKVVIYFKKGETHNLKLATPVEFKTLEQTFTLPQIYSYYYSVKGPSYHFKGERHNYCELVYVDSGALNTTVDAKSFDINEHELLIFGKGSFHTQAVISERTSSYLTIMFEMEELEFNLLKNRIYKANDLIIKTLDRFVSESSSNLPYKQDSLLVLLKLIIIELLRYDFLNTNLKISTPIQKHYESELINEIIKFINSHLFEALSIDDICRRFSLSRSSLQNLFKDNLNLPPKHYINEAKLKKACLMIKEGKYNITEISMMLGFNSIHYFSRKFTKRYKVTPSEYARSIFKELKKND